MIADLTPMQVLLVTLFGAIYRVLTESSPGVVLTRLDEARAARRPPGLDVAYLPPLALVVIASLLVGVSASRFRGR